MFQINELMDLLKKYYSGQLLRAESIETFKNKAVLRGISYDREPQGTPLHSFVSHDDVEYCLDQIHLEPVSVGQYTIYGFYEFVLECVIGNQSPGLGENAAYPIPDDNHNRDAFLFFAKLLSDRIFTEDKHGKPSGIANGQHKQDKVKS